jgi:hypothetical protein
MVNLLGVSYAQWNNNLGMDVSITTGSIFPRYIEDASNNTGRMKTSKAKARELEDANIKKDKSMGEINARFINDNTLELTGWCYPDFSKDISVSFGNDGTLPIIYKSMEADDDGEIVKQIQYNGSNIKENNKKIKRGDQVLIDSKGKEKIDIHIEAIADDQIEYGNRLFTYELQFEQGFK